MPNARKTIKVTDVVDVANQMLRDSVPTADRNGVIVMLETLLHDAGAYRGFQFVDGANGERDNTRRRYYGGSEPFYPLTQVTD